MPAEGSAPPLRAPQTSQVVARASLIRVQEAHAHTAAAGEAGGAAGGATSGASSGAAGVAAGEPARGASQASHRAALPTFTRVHPAHAHAAGAAAGGVAVSSRGRFCPLAAEPATVTVCERAIAALRSPEAEAAAEEELAKQRLISKQCSGSWDQSVKVGGSMYAGVLLRIT